MSCKKCKKKQKNGRVQSNAKNSIVFWHQQHEMQIINLIWRGEFLLLTTSWYVRHRRDVFRHDCLTLFSLVHQKLLELKNKRHTKTIHESILHQLFQVTAQRPRFLNIDLLHIVLITMISVLVRHIWVQDSISTARTNGEFLLFDTWPASAFVVQVIKWTVMQFREFQTLLLNMDAIPIFTNGI